MCASLVSKITSLLFLLLICENKKTKVAIPYLFIYLYWSFKHLLFFQKLTEFPCLFSLG